MEFSLLLGLFLVFVVIVFGTLFYKKNSDKLYLLSTQNRLLNAMRSLDVAALSNREVLPLCQSIVNIIHNELGSIFAVIALVDEKEGVIKRVAISLDSKLDRILHTIITVPFKSQIVRLDDQNNLFNRVITDRKSYFTSNLYDIQKGVLPEEISRKIQLTFNIKGIFLYPLFSKDKVVGILEYTPTKEREKLPQIELSIMEGFAAEVSRALENAMLYSELKATSEKLVEANTRLQELDKMKDDFVSIASHELRTPMTAIRSYAWMALNRADIPLSEKMKKYLTRTLMSTERLINLVNDMLNISRIESGRIEIKPVVLDMAKLMDDVSEEIKVKAVEKALNITTKTDGIIPKVFADPDKVHQVLLNLIGNAMKFTPNGGNVTISFFTDGQVLDISVKDSGVGISKDDLGKLFQKFGRLDSSYVAVASSGGTGLGLYICRNLVELMHGKIWASSEGRGTGSTFTFSLPLATPEHIAEAEKYKVKPTGEVKTLEPVAI